jgi:hypothetical protein
MKSSFRAGLIIAEIRRAIDAVEAELFSGIIRQDESSPLPGDRHEFALPGGRAEALIAAAGVFRAEILGDHVCGPACIKPRKPSRRWLEYLAQWAAETGQATCVA